MPSPLMRLLQRQHGLLTTQQAHELGISSSALSRRTVSGDTPCQRVLPRVYGFFTGEPSAIQRAAAAALYVGQAAQVTGSAALVLHGVRRIAEPRRVDVLVPERRCVQHSGFVTVVRVHALAQPRFVKGIPLAPVARAVVDATGRCTTYDQALDLTSAAIMSRRTTLADVTDAVMQSSSRRTKLLRLVLLEAEKGSRSVPEAAARQLFDLAGLPEALVNEPIEVNGEVFVPDFRWGRFIVEIDSKEWHLLVPGSWDRTQERRTRLEAAGYRVLPISPAQIRDSPAEVIAAVRMGYEASLRSAR